MPHSIFILDDDTDVLELIKCMFEKFDQVKIHLFSDPVQALQQIYHEGIPDLIITDLELPAMNGLEFLAKVEKKYPSLRAVIFTGAPEKVPAGCIYPVVTKDANAYRLLYHMVEIMLDSG